MNDCTVVKVDDDDVDEELGGVVNIDEEKLSSVVGIIIDDEEGTIPKKENILTGTGNGVNVVVVVVVGDVSNMIRAFTFSTTS